MNIHYKWRFLLLKNINYPGLAESMIWLNFPMWNPQILGFRIEPKSHAAAPAPGQETVLCENQSLQVRNGPGNPAKPDESMGFNGDLMTYNGIYWSFSDVMVIFDGIFQGRSNFLKTNKIMGDFRWFEQQERAGLKNVGSCKRWETSSFFVCEITIQWPLNRHLSPSNLQKSPSKSQW